MPDLAGRHARACLHGILAVLMLYLVALAGAVAAAAQQPPEPRPWTRASAGALLSYVEAIASHGLDPADYAPAELRQALTSGDPAAIEDRATQSFGLVARDLAQGRVRPGRRGGSLIASDPLQPERVARLIDQAIATRDVAGVLDRLAPRLRQYRMLRAALAALPPGRQDERQRIEVSLERWRWLPRDLGERYLLVNIPEYRLRLIAGDAELASHRVIVGAVRTPTPQFTTMVTGIVFNPPWHVPRSIVAESVGALIRTNPAAARARGYSWSGTGSGLQVVQQPGPNNALGQMKLDMPNPLAIYVHDTPGKALFEEDVRTFSHGCIRTEHPFDLAAALLTGPEWDRARIDGLIAAGRTTTVPLARPIPFYATYLTAVAEADGTIRYHPDPYALDAAIVAQLHDGGERASSGGEAERPVGSTAAAAGTASARAPGGSGADQGRIATLSTPSRWCANRS